MLKLRLLSNSGVLAALVVQAMVRGNILTTTSQVVTANLAGFVVGGSISCPLSKGVVVGGTHVTLGANGALDVRHVGAPFTVVTRG